MTTIHRLWTRSRYWTRSWTTNTYESLTWFNQYTENRPVSVINRPQALSWANNWFNSNSWNRIL